MNDGKMKNRCSSLFMFLLTMAIENKIGEFGWRRSLGTKKEKEKAASTDLSDTTSKPMDSAPKPIPKKRAKPDSNIVELQVPSQVPDPKTETLPRKTVRNRFVSKAYHDTEVLAKREGYEGEDVKGAAQAAFKKAGQIFDASWPRSQSKLSLIHI